MQIIKAARRNVYPVMPLVVLSALLCLSSCDDPYPQDQWWERDSVEQPPPIAQDGVVWQARSTGENKWCYYPQALCAFFDHVNYSEWGSINSATLVVGGRRWVLTPNDKNGWHICPPWTKTDEERDQDSNDLLKDAFIALLIIVGLVGAAYAAGTKTGSTKFEEEAIKEEKKNQHALALRENDLRQKEAGNEYRLQMELEKLDRARQQLAAKEAELNDRRQRELASLRSAEMMLRKPSDATPIGISQYLRQQHLQGVVLGDLVTATFLADRSGFIRIAWKVQIDRPQPPTVRLVRDGKIIHSDASLAGEHGDHIVPGRRYVYAIGLLDDHGRSIGKGAEFEMKIPTEAVWNRDLGGDDNERQRKIREQFMSRFNGFQVTEELKQECYSEVKAKGYPKDVEDWLFSKIDGLAAELSGEA